jgi:hypothetical protein
MGVILCAGKDNDLAYYPCQGLAHSLFDLKYLIDPPLNHSYRKFLERKKAKPRFTNSCWADYVVLPVSICHKNGKNGQMLTFFIIFIGAYGSTR